MTHTSGSTMSRRGRFPVAEMVQYVRMNKWAGAKAVQGGLYGEHVARNVKKKVR